MIKRLRKQKIRWYPLILPIASLTITILLYLLLPNLELNLSEKILSITSKIILSIIFILGGWFINKIVQIIINFNVKNLDLSKEDNLYERKVLTRMRYVKILITIIIFLVSIALALRQFDTMRELSTSILASAGIIGLVIAFSAQKFFANILAGFEIAFNQPIRTDDVVVVEGEWGRIEEINATNVIVRIWDERRLVLPITYFVEKPFQNWTKKNSDILGSAEFYLDYGIPIEPMRKELTKILKKSPLWDGKVNVLQVTDTTEKSIKVRALMSAKDSGKAWDLRCYVREHMLKYLQSHHEEHLPKLRTIFEEKNKQNSRKKNFSKKTK